jgi:hypothetical protein
MNMLDTIEMLEAIGSDASLRYASTVELANVLEQAKATEALTAAVVSGDASLLTQEFGSTANLVPQAIQTFSLNLN